MVCGKMVLNGWHWAAQSNDSRFMYLKPVSLIASYVYFIYFIMKIVQVVHTEERRKKKQTNKQTNEQT